MKGKDQSNEIQIGGLRIRNLNFIFIIALMLFTTILFVSTMNLSTGYRELIKTTDDYHRIERDARMVQSASDDLTRDAQLFVMTGTRSYMDSYFREADETKRRENAINDLTDLHATDSLMQLLENSVQESMNLMLLEYEAMRYASEGYHLEIKDLPEQVRNTTLPEEAEGMTDLEKIQRAQEIAFGEDYAGYKTRIRGFEQEYLEEAIKLMDEQQEQKRNHMQRDILLQRVGLVLISLIGWALFLTIAMLIVRPLNHAVRSISKGESIDPIKGTYEIQYMSHTYNGFHKNSMELQKTLKQEAERDALTGVLNRRGYQMVIDRLKAESFPMAFLIMDVDDFKLVNDRYGHAVGDVALKKAAHLLMSSFRDTDITSRIGGDEFTVIMSDTTHVHLETIQQKINQINEELMHPDTDDCPPISMSVGCAFSSQGYNEKLFVQADSKMYEAKEAGGASIRFYV